MAGDLFVHLFSGVHLITDTHGPTRAQATGGLRFWKDGRDVPDVMMALYDYEKGFNLSVRTNFVNGGAESEGFVFTGSEGSMTILGDGVTISRVPRETEPGYRVDLYSAPIQRRMIEVYHEKYPMHPVTGTGLAGEEKYVAPQGLQRPLRSREELDRSHPHAPTCGGRPSVRIPRCRRRTAQQCELRQRQGRSLGCGGNEAALRHARMSRFNRGHSGGAIVDKSANPRDWAVVLAFG